MKTELEKLLEGEFTPNGHSTCERKPIAERASRLPGEPFDPDPINAPPAPGSLPAAPLGRPVNPIAADSQPADCPQKQGAGGVGHVAVPTGPTWLQVIRYAKHGRLKSARKHGYKPDDSFDVGYLAAIVANLLNEPSRRRSLKSELSKFRDA